MKVLVNMSMKLVWIEERSNIYDHCLAFGGGGVALGGPGMAGLPIGAAIAGYVSPCSEACLAGGLAGFGLIGANLGRTGRATFVGLTGRTG